MGRRQLEGRQLEGRQLEGKRIAFLVTDGVEQVELSCAKIVGEFAEGPHMPGLASMGRAGREEPGG